MRGIHSISLTPAGNAFAAKAEEWIAMWDSMKSSIELLDTRDEPVILSIQSLGCFSLLPFCNAFFSRYPNGAFHIDIERPRDIYGSVVRGEADIGILCMNKHTNNTVSIPVASEKFVFICRKDSGYPDKLYTRDLNPQKEIFFTWGSENETWHDYWFGVNGHYSRIHGSIQHLKYFFNGFYDWSVVPASIFNSLGEDFRVCELDSLPADRTICIIKRTNYNEQFQEVLDLLKQSLLGQPGITLF